MRSVSVRLVGLRWGICVVTGIIVKRRRAAVIFFLRRRRTVVRRSRLFGSVRFCIGIVGLRSSVRIIRSAGKGDAVSPQKRRSKCDAGSSIKPRDREATLLGFQAK